MQQQHGRNRKAFGVFPKLTDRSPGGQAGVGEKHRSPVLKGATGAGQTRPPRVSAAAVPRPGRGSSVCLHAAGLLRHGLDTALCWQRPPLLRGSVEGPPSCRKNVGREPGRSCEPTGEAPQSEDHGEAPPLPAASRNGRTFTSVSTGAVRSPQLIKPGGSVSKFFFKMERNHSDNLAIYNRARAGSIANFLRTGSGWVHSFGRPKCKLQSCLVSRKTGGK